MAFPTLALGPRITSQQVREWMLGDHFVPLMSHIEHNLEDAVKSGALKLYSNTQVQFRHRNPGIKEFWDLAHQGTGTTDISYGLPENIIHAPGMLMMAIYHRLDLSGFTVDKATIFHYQDGLGYKDEYTFDCTIKTTA